MINGNEGYPDRLRYLAKLYPAAQDIKSPITLIELSPRYSPDVPVDNNYYFLNAQCAKGQLFDS